MGGALTATPRTEASERLLPLGRHGEVAVRWVRDRRARRLRLSVSERGVRLTLPWRASEFDASHFLAQHLGWLGEQLDRRRQLAPTQRFEPGAELALLLRGERLPVLWQQARFARIRREPEALHVEFPVAAGAARVAALYRDFLQAEARGDIGRWLPPLLPGLPRSPARFKLDPLSSLWGALNPSGVVSLDLALMLAPPPVFRYVLVHELCHLLQPNHSRAFWREVEARCPDWRVQRQWLGRHGEAIKGELAGLLGRR